MNFILPFGLTALFLSLMRPLAFRIGLVDIPTGRKLHSGTVPLIGGAAIYTGLLGSMYQFGITFSDWQPLLVAAGMLLLVGLWDDYNGVGVRTRFLVQIIAVLLIALWGGTRLESLGDLLGLGGIELGLIAVPFTVFGAVGVMNSFNMIDGMDGLSSGIGLILLGILCGLLWVGGYSEDFKFVFLLFSCISGFFIFNFRFAKQQHVLAFLGDSGSLFLGVIIAYLLVKYSQEPYEIIRPVTALWLFAVPLMDTVSIMFRRAKGGRSPFDADHGHLHHVLLKAGVGVRLSTILILALQMVCCTAGLIGDYFEVPEYQMFYAFLALFGLYCIAMTRTRIADKATQQLQARYRCG